MTIHKSKGLEFDIVIVPHLEKITPLSEKPILDWTYAQNGLDFHLLMHTHPRHRSHQNSIHKYLRSVEKRAEMAEFERLYYVAFTRAKFQLHLVSDQKASYPERSIMKKLAPILDTNIPDIKTHQYQPHHKTDRIEQSSLRYCLPAFWTHPLNLALSEQSFQTTKPNESPGFVLKDLFDDAVCMDTQWGKLVHRFMELALHPNHTKLPSYEKFLQVALQFQIDQAHHDRALVKLFDKLSDLPSDRHFVWLKNSSTNMSECTVIHHEKKHRIDYVFIDNTTHTLWIVDFKTSQINQFLSTGKTHFPDAIPSQYHKQLSTYANCLQPIFPDLQIQTALYYPLIPKFIKIT